MRGCVTGGAVAAIALLCSGALAAEMTPEQRMADDTFDTVVYWGADYYGGAGRYGYGVDAGMVTALNGDIGASGWTLTMNVGGSRSVDGLANTNSFAASALVGYLWNAPSYYITLGGGIHFVRNNETPPGGVTHGSFVGAIAQYGFETTGVNTLYVQSYGSASTVNNQLYGHAKVGYKMPVLRLGAEFTAFDDRGSAPTLRYGAFVGDIPLGERLSMVVSAGYQDEQNPALADSFYATIGFAVPLSLR